MKILSLLALIIFCSCTSHTSAVSGVVENQVDGRPAIIFVPGFYGSALRTKSSGKRIFLTGWEALFGDSALSLFQTELGTPRGPELEVEGVLGAVPVVPGLYEVDVYSPLLYRLRQLRPDAQILPLAYDWRDDLSLAVNKLDNLVNLLLSKNCKSVSIVSHSMGGMIVTYYLAYGNQPPESAQINWSGAKVISKAVFFGTPFMGSMIAFRSFEKGSGIAHSDKLLSADTMSSFPSMYQLLPSLATLRDQAGTKLTVDMFDPEFWKKNHLGLLRRTTLPTDFLEQRVHFLTEQLAKARRWSDLIQLGHTAAWQPPAHLKVLNFVGSGSNTLDSGYLEPATGKLFFDPKELASAGLKGEPLFNNGDITVTMTSSAVPAALEAATKQVVLDGASHEKLFLDPVADKEYKLFLEKPSAPKPY